MPSRQINDFGQKETEKNELGARPEASLHTIISCAYTLDTFKKSLEKELKDNTQGFSNTICNFGSRKSTLFCKNVMFFARRKNEHSCFPPEGQEEVIFVVLLFVGIISFLFFHRPLDVCKPHIRPLSQTVLDFRCL